MYETTHLSASARDLLGDVDELVSQGWIAATGPASLDVVDPSTGSTVGSVPASSAADVSTAVTRARTAFDSGAWSSLSPAERSRRLHRLTDVLTSHASELAEIGTLEVGSPITLSRG